MSDWYEQALLDPRWKKLRRRIICRDYFMCTQCGDKESALHVHHKTYLSGLQPWEYDPDLLITLCERCHIKHHRNQPDPHPVKIPGLSGIGKIPDGAYSGLSCDENPKPPVVWTQDEIEAAREMTRRIEAGEPV